MDIRIAHHQPYYASSVSKSYEQNRLPDFPDSESTIDMRWISKYDGLLHPTVPQTEGTKFKDRYRDIRSSVTYAVRLGKTFFDPPIKPVSLEGSLGKGEPMSDEISDTSYSYGPTISLSDSDAFESRFLEQNSANSKVLQKFHEENPQSYINASYVPEPRFLRSDRELLKRPATVFIASQAPLSRTTSDFWKMINQNDVHVVVMLTNLLENRTTPYGSVPSLKAHYYWPKIESASKKEAPISSLASVSGNQKQKRIPSTASSSTAEANKSPYLIFKSPSVTQDNAVSSSTMTPTSAPPSGLASESISIIFKHPAVPDFGDISVDFADSLDLSASPSVSPATGDFSVYLLRDTLEFQTNIRILYLRVATPTEANFDHEFGKSKLFTEHDFQRGFSSRIVTQYHFRDWPDHGVVSDFRHYSSLHSMVERSAMKNPKSPILVHCSAGVGRTGTFIANYYLMMHMRATFVRSLMQINPSFTVDNLQSIQVNFSEEQLERAYSMTREKTNLSTIFPLIASMRSSRSYMVQTVDQYNMIMHFVIISGFFMKTWIYNTIPQKTDIPNLPNFQDQCPVTRSEFYTESHLAMNKS